MGYTANITTISLDNFLKIWLEALKEEEREHPGAIKDGFKDTYGKPYNALSEHARNNIIYLCSHWNKFYTTEKLHGERVLDAIINMASVFRMKELTPDDVFFQIEKAYPIQKVTTDPIHVVPSPAFWSTFINKLK